MTTNYDLRTTIIRRRYRLSLTIKASVILSDSRQAEFYVEFWKYFILYNKKKVTVDY
jgi:hypothetical protein